MNDLNKQIAFLESLPEVSASITQPLEETLPSYENVQKLFDKVVSELAKNGDYANIMSMYHTSQMYGKNGSLESFFTAFAEMYKKSAKQEQLHIVDMLCKNIKNTTHCIDALSKHKKEMLIALMFGFVSSMLSQNS